MTHTTDPLGAMSAMRWIAPEETCFSASEIAQRFEALTAIDLHPTNVGQVAKSLNLDFVEVECLDLDPPWNSRRKLYSEVDLPRIFDALKRKVRAE